MAIVVPQPRDPYGRGVAQAEGNLGSAIQGVGNQLANVAIDLANADKATRAREDAATRLQLMAEAKVPLQQIYQDNFLNTPRTPENITGMMETFGKYVGPLVEQAQFNTEEGRRDFMLDLQEQVGSYRVDATKLAFERSGEIAAEGLNDVIAVQSLAIDKAPSTLGDSLAYAQEWIEKNAAAIADPAAEYERVVATLAPVAIRRFIADGQFTKAEQVLSQRDITTMLTQEDITSLPIEIRDARLAQSDDLIEARLNEAILAEKQVTTQLRQAELQAQELENKRKAEGTLTDQEQADLDSTMADIEATKELAAQRKATVAKLEAETAVIQQARGDEGKTEMERAQRGVLELMPAYLDGSITQAQRWKLMEYIGTGVDQGKSRAGTRVNLAGPIGAFVSQALGIENFDALGRPDGNATLMAALGLQFEDDPRSAQVEARGVAAFDQLFAQAEAPPETPSLPTPTITVQDERINNGRPTNIPQSRQQSESGSAEALAIEAAVQSGETFDAYETPEEAADAAAARQAEALANAETKAPEKPLKDAILTPPTDVPAPVMREIELAQSGAKPDGESLAAMRGFGLKLYDLAPLATGFESSFAHTLYKTEALSWLAGDQSKYTNARFFAALTVRKLIGVSRSSLKAPFAETEWLIREFEPLQSSWWDNPEAVQTQLTTLNADIWGRMQRIAKQLRDNQTGKITLQPNDVSEYQKSLAIHAAARSAIGLPVPVHSNDELQMFVDSGMLNGGDTVLDVNTGIEHILNAPNSGLLQ